MGLSCESHFLLQGCYFLIDRGLEIVMEGKSIAEGL